MSRPAALFSLLSVVEDNPGALLLLFGLLSVGLYYVVAWSKVGRNPKPGEIVPLSTPPVGLGPAEARFIWKQRFDDAAFASALFGLAVKGRITIDDDGRDFAIRKHADDGPELTNVEAALYSTLPDARTRLERTAQLTLLSMRSEVKRALKGQYEGVLFRRNWAWFWGGALSTTAIFVGAALLLPLRESVIGFSLLGWWCLWWGATLAVGWEDFDRFLNERRAARSLRRVWFYVPFIVAGPAAPLIVLSVAESATLCVVVAVGMSLVAMNLLFFRLLRAPTLAGRVILDQLEGFRLFMTNKPQPVADAASLFESYLPYALAMDCERAWNARFGQLLAAGAAGPPWYSGRRWHRYYGGSRGDGLASHFSSSLAAASSAPGSSSSFGDASRVSR